MQPVGSRSMKFYCGLSKGELLSTIFDWKIMITKCLFGLFFAVVFPVDANAGRLPFSQDSEKRCCEIRTRSVKSGRHKGL